MDHHQLSTPLTSILTKKQRGPVPQKPPQAPPFSHPAMHILRLPPGEEHPPL